MAIASCAKVSKNTELISHLQVDKSRPGFTVKVLAPACGLPGQPLERRCHVLRRKGLCANSWWQRADSEAYLLHKMPQKATC